MQYSPKLKKAMEEINQILDKHDIGAFVLLSDGEGFSEFRNKIDPSWSCMFNHQLPDGSQGVRFKAKGKDEKTKKMVSASVNMLSHFVDQLSLHAAFYTQLQGMLKDKVDIERGPDSTTGHVEQNN
jgi:hypothetical protein